MAVEKRLHSHLEEKVESSRFPPFIFLDYSFSVCYNMSNSRDQYNQDDVRVHNGHYNQHGSNHTVPVTIWNVTYTMSERSGGS